MLIVNGHPIAPAIRKARRLCPGRALGVDYVIESTGLFTGSKAKGANGRAKKVIHLRRPRTRTLPSSWR